MNINEKNNRKEQALNAAKQIATAARTAPKARGVDLVEIAILTDENIEDLAHKMRIFYEEHQQTFFLRDADNLLHSQAVVLIGTRQQPMELDCGYCGAKNCADKSPKTPCVMNVIDAGIAIGSAIAMAADLRIDCRVMFSVGSTAMKYNILPDCHTIFGIPLSISGKSPFFDRKAL